MEKDARDLKKRKDGAVVSVKEMLKAAWARDLRARDLANEAMRLQAQSNLDLAPSSDAVLAEPEDGSLESEIAQLQSSLTSLEAEKHELQSDNERLVKEVSGLQSRVSGLESTVLSLRDEISQLRAKATTGNITVARSIQQTQRRKSR